MREISINPRIKASYSNKEEADKFNLSRISIGLRTIYVIPLIIKIILNDSVISPP